MPTLWVLSHHCTGAISPLCCSMPPLYMSIGTPLCAHAHEHRVHMLTSTVCIPRDQRAVQSSIDPYGLLLLSALCAQPSHAMLSRCTRREPLVQCYSVCLCDDPPGPSLNMVMQTMSRYLLQQYR